MSKRIQRDYLLLVGPLWKRTYVRSWLGVCEVGPEYY
jgi:hypothetical protein